MATHLRQNYFRDKKILFAAALKSHFTIFYCYRNSHSTLKLGHGIICTFIKASTGGFREQVTMHYIFFPRFEPNSMHAYLNGKVQVYPVFYPHQSTTYCYPVEIEESKPLISPLVC